MNPFDYDLAPAPYAVAYQPLRVTFLVVAHNNASCLSGTLESVWHEANAAGGEIVLVDDGSTDGSEAICAEFAASRARVRYWRQSHHGLYRTLNMVAGSARGEWVRPCAGDTPLVPNSTKRLIAAAERTGAGIAAGGVVRWGAGTTAYSRPSMINPDAEKPRLHAQGLTYVLRSLNFPLSSVLYRQELVERALPLPADLIACPNLTLLFSALKHATLARLQQPVCISLDIRPERRAGDEALALQQTVRILQQQSARLSRGQQRVGLYSAANRTRRWLRRFHRERNSPGLQVWLLGIALCGRVGLLDFSATLECLAQLCEADLHAVLAPPRLCIQEPDTAGWAKPVRPPAYRMHASPAMKTLAA